MRFSFFLLLSLATLASPSSRIWAAEGNSIDDYAIEEDELIKNLEEKIKNERLTGPKQTQEELKHYEPSKVKNEAYQDDVQIFWGYLKEGSTITEVFGEKKSFKTPKKIYVQVRKERNNYQTYFLLNKEGQVRYSTRREFIIPLDDVADLHPIPKNYVEHGPPKEYDGGDSKITLKPYYALHLESFSDQGQTAKATRNELKLFYGWKLPYEFGLSASLETGTYQSSESATSETTWQTFYLGPAVHWLAYRNDITILSLDLSLQKSVGYITQSPSTEDRFSAEAFEFGGDLLFPTRLGEFTTGMHWRILRKALDASTGEIHTPQTDKSGFTAFSFSVGYGKEFSW